MSWMGSRNSAPPSAPYTANVTVLAALNWAELNRFSGSIGMAARRSQATNAASRITPPVSAVSGTGEVQPAPGAWISPYVSPTSGEPLVIIVQAAEKLHEDELAVVVDAADRAHRRVILRVMADRRGSFMTADVAARRSGRYRAAPAGTRQLGLTRAEAKGSGAHCPDRRLGHRAPGSFRCFEPCRHGLLDLSHRFMRGRPVCGAVRKVGHVSDPRPVLVAPVHLNRICRHGSSSSCKLYLRTSAATSDHLGEALVGDR